jgi:hypothetical protein
MSHLNKEKTKELRQSLFVWALLVLVTPLVDPTKYCDFPPCISSWEEFIVYIFTTQISRFIYLLSLIAAAVLTVIMLIKKESRKRFLIWAVILAAIGLIPWLIIVPLLSPHPFPLFTPRFPRF